LAKTKRKSDELSALDRFLRAISHPTRRLILAALVEEVGSAKSLSVRFDMPLGDVSYHLNRVLARECDVVELVATIPRRGSMEKIYAIREGVAVGLASWPGIPDSVRKSAEGMSLREFLKVTESAIESGAIHALEGAALGWSPALVDWDCWLEIRDAVQHFNATVSAAVRKYGDRQPNGKLKDEAYHVVIGSAAFQTAL
jgi:DNA-binding transcriptional ArsR family regulator